MDNELRAEGARALAAVSWSVLNLLSLKENNLRPKGGSALARMPALRHLYLTDSRLG